MVFIVLIHCSYSVSLFPFLRIESDSGPSPVHEAEILLSHHCLSLHDPQVNFRWKIAFLDCLVLHHVRDVLV